MTAEKKLSKIEGVCFIVALIFGLIIQGSLPFVTTPTLGQAVWTTGFSQSFLNESVFSIYARNFGAPEPAPIAFGLAGAWLTALFLKIGLHPADSYSAMVAFWMTIAFLSSYLVARYFSVNRLLSILAALSWITMPIIWAHAGYSMVSIGISLLPLYFFSAINVFHPKTSFNTKTVPKYALIFHFIVCIVAVFMDGYSFMMFAMGASILGASFFIYYRENRKYYLKIAFPIHFIGLGLSYLLYAIYIGKTQFDSVPIEFFRGWGVDLSFLFLPTTGMHWVADLLGWSVLRSENEFFGDASVWITTFSIPIIFGAMWAISKNSYSKGIIIGFFLIALFGFYMSLGPSVKFFSVKPEDEKIGQMMGKEYAIAPTGSALISNHVPGFKNMRASYRWAALGIFGSWVLLTSAMSITNRYKIKIGTAIITSFVILFNLPNVPERFFKASDNRKMFVKLESDLIDDLRMVVVHGETIAFLPWRNDFLVNYIAARNKIVTYNIGGDKNLSEARKNWPDIMRSFPMAKIDPDFVNRIVLLLAQNEADAVILPYIDMLWAAHFWPHPLQFKDSFYPIIQEINDLGIFLVKEREFYSYLRLKPEFFKMAKEDNFEKVLNELLCLPPFCIKKSRFDQSTFKKVGDVQDGKIVSNGNSGFLHFGPYTPMNAGKFNLIVYGSVEGMLLAYVDVVSKKGKIKHNKFLLNEKHHSDSIIVDGTIIIDQPVDDLEIRVYVNESDYVVLEGYELTPLN